MIDFKKHRHRPHIRLLTAYRGAVAQPENRAAHGNVRKLDECRCGARRETNVNGVHVERGEWS